jgi:hypothetical protein
MELSAAVKAAVLPKVASAAVVGWAVAAKTATAATALVDTVLLKDAADLTSPEVGRAAMLVVEATRPGSMVKAREVMEVVRG